MTDNGELTEREREVLELVAGGATNKEIASKLYISPNTVKVHLRNIFAKAGVGSRTEATLFAIRSGLVSLGDDGGPSSISDRSPVNISAALARPLAHRNRWIMAAGAMLLVLAAAVLAFRFFLRSSSEEQASLPQPQGLDESRWIDLPPMRAER
ncbi:MAG: response regulator transcription factor, partial [Anaerolineales bacterium]